MRPNTVNGDRPKNLMQKRTVEHRHMNEHEQKKERLQDRMDKYGDVDNFDTTVKTEVKEEEIQ